ncbi:MAG: 6-phosphogluconolactonase, partial [Bacteroidetes bacterium]|nr:6-phosphogluconolactonase [Bacteroidota bacterium]
MYNNVKIFDSPIELARSLSLEIQSAVNNKADKFALSISGGSTPTILFNQLAQPPYKNEINWNKLNFFWCDERCVSPTDSQSNYGEVKKNLFDFISIPEMNIHRIRGESDPNEETVRYASEVESCLPFTENKLPQFDWVLLGVGGDGHTASLFPGKNFLFIYSNIAGVAQHPATGQKRISLTKEVLNNSKRISFIVTGKSKAKVI